MEEATAAGLEEPLTAFQFTPFEERARPLIFPYLICEAKTERGDSFEACERQTAFPIWNLLNLQLGLQVKSRERLEEQGGPFIWFFANRGEEWRLYGCFTDIEDDDNDQGTSYIIQDLWTGRVDSQDGALQLLLLIDYISDWGRDLYRPGIARLLKLIVDNTTKGTNDEIESLQFGTDFSSMSQGLSDRQDQMDLDRPSPDAPDPPIILQQIPHLPQEEFQKWQATDTVTGVFRDGNILESCFEYVHFKNDIFETLLAPFVTSDIPEERLTQFVLAVHQAFLSYSVTISDDVLGHLEELWTGYRRPENDLKTGLMIRNAIMVYYTHISEGWQPRRAIACIVLEDDVFKKMHDSIGRSISSATGSSVPPKEVTSYDVTALVQHLRRQSTKSNLIAAIETRSGFLVKAGSSGRGFALRPCQPFGIPALFQVLRSIHPDHPRSSIEHIARFSNIVDYQRISTADGKPSPMAPFDTYPLFKEYGARPKTILVYSNYMREVNEFGGPEWCLFCLYPGEAPNLKLQYRLLVNLREEEGFYFTTYFWSRVEKTSHWRPYNDWRALTPDVNGALTQWKAMLEDLDTIKYVASLVDSKALALSGSIKQSMAGRKRKTGPDATRSGLKSWDMFKGKQELMNRESE